MSLRRLIGVIAALALATLPVACGGDGGGGAGSAEDLLRRAAERTAESADVKIELEATLDGVDELRGPVRFTLEGPYRSNGDTTLPDLDWQLHGEAGGKSFDAGLVMVPDNAYVEYGGTTYEVGERLVEQLTGQLRSGQADPDELRRAGFDTSGWIDDPEVSDAEVGGVPTKRISGEVDVRTVLESLDKLFQSPAVSGQLPPGSSPPRISDRTIDEVEDAVTESRIETDVGRDDGIMRRNVLELGFEIPEDRREDVKGLEGGRIETLFELTDVNGSQHVSPPSGARPIDELLRGIGIPPQLLLGPGFTTPAPG